MAVRFSPVLRRLLSTRAYPARGGGSGSITGGEVSASSGPRLTDHQGLGPKRFYKEVTVDTTADKQYYTVKLDGTPVRTPKRSVLGVATEGLAIAIAAEWDSQVGRIRPSSMPMTTITTTALDVVPEFRDKIISSLLGYIHTDSICIRAATPRELVVHQSTRLDVITRHFKRKYGVDIKVDIGGFFDAAQSPEVCDLVHNILDTSCAFELAALDSAAATAKSVLLSIAMRDGAVDCDGALEAARSEERWQASVWGLVEGGHDTADADTAVRLGAADLMFRLIEAHPNAFARAEEDTSARQ